MLKLNKLEEEFKKLSQVLKELEKQRVDKDVILGRLERGKGELYGDIAMGKAKEEEGVKLEQETEKLDKEIKKLEVTIKELGIRKTRLERQGIGRDIYNLS